MSTSAGEILDAIPLTSDGAPAPVVELPEPPELDAPEPPLPKGNWLPVPEPELPPDVFGDVAAVVAVGQVAWPTVAPSRRATTATREAISATCPLWFFCFDGGGGGVG
jgi:hypothetical protein